MRATLATPTRLMPVLQRSLRNKVLAVLLLPTLLTLLVLGVLVYLGAREALEQELGERLAVIGQTLSADFSQGVEAAQLDRLDATKARTRTRLIDRLEQVRASTHVRRIFIMDEDFRSLVDTEPDVHFHQRLFAFEGDGFEVARAVKGRHATSSVLFEGEDGTLYKTSYMPILLVPEALDDVASQASPPPDDEARVVAIIGVVASASFFDVLNGLTQRFLGLGLLGLILMLVIGVWFSRRLTRPLSALVEAAQRLERGEMDAPVLSSEAMHQARRGDEIDRLATSFEEMRRAVLDRDHQMQMMLSGIAHEVRNPLGGMELFCGLLKEDLQADPHPDASRLDKITRIERELIYLNRVVTNFLDFARHRQLELERFSAHDLLSEVSMLLCAETEGAGCDIRVDAPFELELTADRERLRRALINTVRNAWQASPAGGEILLAAHAPGPQRRVISVRDHGEGIPQDKLDEILTPFFTTREKGSGLGLAMTQKIVGQHGGELRIESAPGGGTCVVFEIPFDPSLQVVETAAIPEGWLG